MERSIGECPLLAESKDSDACECDYIVTENYTGRMLRSVEFKQSCVYRDGAHENLVNILLTNPGK